MIQPIIKRSAIIFFAIAGVEFFFASIARAAVQPVKLPYPKGESFVVVQGYNSPPTHIKKDSYAMDLSQDGCDAYGKLVVAAASGNAMTVLENGYNGGYGTEIIIDHGNNIVSRYAHMIPWSIAAAVGGFIYQGQVIGQIGNTGLVAGLACGDHPGTHLHFAMDILNSDGSLTAYDPEPISGYRNITAGNWYTSDNAEYVPAPPQVTVAPAPTSPASPVAPAVIPALAPPPATSTAISVPATTSPQNIPSGGVTVVVSSPPAAPASSAPAAPPDVTSSSIDTTSTPDATSTPPSSSSTVASSSSPILFQQLDDSAESAGSWYDDNWFDLGTGIGGMLNTLTLEGKVSFQPFFSSHVSLQEFRDASYTTMIQEYIISNDAPFTLTMATATFTGLSVPLKPYFYYRLATVQDYQNRSVILAGTSATGTMMWDGFVYGVGRVESTGTFMPFIVMGGIAPTSTLTPPPITTPAHLAASFDELGMQVALSWSTSTDPDWPGNPLGYEMNYSTSSVLDDDTWQSPASIPVVIDNSYLIGIRARDNFGDVSAVATTTWNFPAGFIPYLLSPSLGYAYQNFTVATDTPLASIGIFTTNLGTTARYVSSVSCSLTLSYSAANSDLGSISADNGNDGFGCVGNPVFSFASSSFMLVPGINYQWIFNISTGNPSTQASVQFYGTAIDTAGGRFSDPSLANAKFIVNSPSGSVFAN